MQRWIAAAAAQNGSWSLLPPTFNRFRGKAPIHTVSNKLRDCTEKIAKLKPKHPLVALLL